MKHLGDITKIDGAQVEPVNVIIGGSPCQDLSIAGNRAGLAGERSGLFMEQIRVIKEMRCADAERGRTGPDIRPRWMVWENVPGAFSSNKGEDFGAVIHETIKVTCPQAPAVSVPKNGWPTSGCLTDMGGKWSLAWRVFDSQFWGVPQRRKRIALVCDFGGLTAPEILFERKGVPGYCPPCGAPWQTFTAPAPGGSAETGGGGGQPTASRGTALTEQTPPDATEKDGLRV
jgi:DNA (cytosine-5)-methyltransferase 1